MNTLELARQYPDAYEALPEPYQNDDCLEFSVKEGKIYCEPAKGQEEWLGSWVAEYSSQSPCWKVSRSHRS